MTILLVVFVSFLNAQNLNINSLEKEIIKYNREGKHTLSQKKLSDLLFSGNLTKEEEANVLFFMASTYRGVSDYAMCIDYLNKSAAIAKDLSKDNVLRMKLDYEYAFVYFDNKEYQKSKKMMDNIAARHYSTIIPEDHAYILMQEGYLFLMNKDYSNAEKKYNEALQIIKSENSCNLPIVYVKLMELYHFKKQIQKVESLYAESVKISKSCGILKYETYAASEMEKIYKENNLLGKAYSVGIRVDSLRKLEDLDNRVSEMHIIDKKYLEKKESLEDESVFWEQICAVLIAVILLLIIAYSFFKSRNLKIEKMKMKEEIEQIKEDLNSYSQKTNLGVKFESTKSSILNSDQLTERQKELVQLMAEGFSNKEIADKLFITESTVKYHIKNIYSILNLKDRKDLFKKISNI
ncbi:LuxR C-terminal-related transcriptional regulator [Epilithonimonas sp. JDS]|uniref:LuxR C-terminal-related transcriptional regulator n=1 Tax=Epilithonimonas sp. JDS TaxID=2902797 RepID=UPI001E2CE43B|nr:LuxR C-terminal-related transcriptional regulator [Epilithonimonas sp. JDS]MCD9855256.1 LuxR C-terminal-related transcriptional regulator [Epilithonimonas sp. JDS]